MSIKTRANLQLVYVSNIDRSVDFYKHLFQCEPVFISPRYVAFPASEQGDALFALWTGGNHPSPSITRLSEIGIMVPTMTTSMPFLTNGRRVWSLMWFSLLMRMSSVEPLSFKILMDT